MQEEPPPREARKALSKPSLAERNAAVWDMVLNLVHPAFLYVLLQLLLLDHLSDTSALREFHPVHPVSLLIHLLQFLGAWAVFYTVLLRDMGHVSPEGTILLLAALAAVVLQWILFPDPRAAERTGVWIFLGVQGLLVDPGRADQIADAIERMVDDTEGRRKMIRGGLAYAAENTFAHMVDQVGAALRSALIPKFGECP